MDFAYTEQQEMLKTMVRDFGEKECPKSLVREMEKDDTGYPEELWKKMAGLFLLTLQEMKIMLYYLESRIGLVDL